MSCRTAARSPTTGDSWAREPRRRVVPIPRRKNPAAAPYSRAMNSCPLCTSEFESSEGCFTEWGLVCGDCATDYALVPTHYPTGGGGGSSDLGKTVGLNVLGIGLMAVTGVGFTYRPAGREEPVPIPEHERLAIFKRAVAERVRRVGPRRLRVIYLRRAAEEAGPYAPSELGKMWEDGLVSATDEFWYEGMDGCAPVTSFAPPPSR